jgi:hypothetical protein
MSRPLPLPLMAGRGNEEASLLINFKFWHVERVNGIHLLSSRVIVYHPQGQCMSLLRRQWTFEHCTVHVIIAFGSESLLSNPPSLFKRTARAMGVPTLGAPHFGVRGRRPR